jgi:hypothetical protein
VGIDEDAGAGSLASGLPRAAMASSSSGLRMYRALGMPRASPMAFSSGSFNPSISGELAIKVLRVNEKKGIFLKSRWRKMRIVHLVYCNSTKFSEIATIMWQRIQTLYMALGAGMFFYVGYSNTSNMQALVSGLGVALLLANITYYKHRKRQFVVNRLAIIVAFALEGWLLYGTYGGKTEAISNAEMFQLAAPLLAVVLTAMANRAIQADEKKVSAADRLR